MSNKANDCIKTGGDYKIISCLLVYESGWKCTLYRWDRLELLKISRYQEIWCVELL